MNHRARLLRREPLPSPIHIHIRGIIGVLASICLTLPSLAPAASVTPGLQDCLDGLEAGQAVPVIIELTPTVDLSRFARGRESAGDMIRALQATATSTQSPVRARLQQLGLERGVRSFWINNSLALEATAAQIEALAADPSVVQVDLDAAVGFAPPAAADGEREPAWNLHLVGAPRVWSELGLTGTGMVVGSMDTGVDLTHPSLAGKWRGGDNSWIDIINGQPAPYDDHGHGTHTIGIMVGGDGPGPLDPDPGLAYDAVFISAKVLDHNNSFSSASTVIAGAQFMLDPDGDPGTDDFPHVINNSWYFYSETYTGFYSSAAAWRAAGIIPVFCLGNEGPSRETTRPPANYNNVIGVGATTSADDMWYYSSRGPSPAGAQFPADRRKPEFGAPGASVTSCIPGGGYQAWSGTSMAAPHVAATVALMLQAESNLTYDGIVSLLASTAVDLGPPGHDDDFGHGRLDTYAAVSALVDPLAVVGLPGAAMARLAPARPNPFNPRTVIEFAVTRSQNVSLAVYDSRGHLVRTLVSGRVAVGDHAVVWQGRDDRGAAVASGTYLCRLVTEDGLLARKMLLAR